MNKFLELSPLERARIFINVGRKLHMSEAIIEKDFWVCWTLKYLFDDFKYKDFICFKGGTSLSKVFKCIDRFSEDIDLTLDWSMIELNKDEAYKNKSNTKQIFFNKNANERTAILLRDHWLPIIEFDFSKQLSEPFHLYVDENDLQTICFAYPRSFEDDSILQIIRLEIGALAETIPSVNGYINPYIADVYPMLFDTLPIKVLGVDISRTFYEKITETRQGSSQTLVW